jgi:hypothetical protein
MYSRIYPCFCGYIPKSVAGMRKHRAICLEWRNRPDPRGLARERRIKSFELSKAEVQPGPCPDCGRFIDHKPDCPKSLILINPESPDGWERTDQERCRRDRVLRAGIDMEKFEAFLRVLARRRD